MLKGKECVKQILQWILAVAVVFLLLNLVCFFYYNPLNGFSMEKSVASVCYYPGDTAYDSSEGFGIVTADHNGFINQELPLREDYILVTGSSHTEAHYLPMELRYGDLLNEKICGENKEELAVYNIGHIFNFYNDIISSLDAIFRVYPNPSALIIEIPHTTYSAEELHESLQQKGYDPEENVSNILAAMNGKQRLVLDIKRRLPLLRLFSLKIKDYMAYREDMEAEKKRAESGEMISGDEETEDTEEIRAAVADTLALLRSYYDGKIIIVFHPDVVIAEDGTMEMVYADYAEIYKEQCEKEGILFIDMSEDFENAYHEQGIIATGFWNTTLGRGHMNRYAHAMVADELYRALMEE